MLYHVASDFVETFQGYWTKQHKKEVLADEMSSKTLAFALKKV